MSPAPAARDAAASRERILDAACDLIAEEGIDEVRIARVATRAGASTALVHHYFSTREELLSEALVHSFVETAAERFGEPGSERAGARSATRTLAVRLAQSLPEPGPQEREWVLWVELWLRAARDPSLRGIAADLYRRYHAWLAAPIVAGVESGEFQRCDPDAVADLAMALLDGYGIRVLLGDPATDLRAARRAVAARLAPELGVPAQRLLPR